jgi:hypothetical protein
MWWTCPDLSSRGAPTPPFISKGPEVIRKVTKSVTTWSLSILYFTYIFIYIIIYTLRSTLRSSEIFWMVGWVVVNPLLDIPSLYGVILRIPILDNDLLVLIKLLWMWSHWRVCWAKIHGIGPLSFLQGDQHTWVGRLDINVRFNGSPTQLGRWQLIPVQVRGIGCTWIQACKNKADTR